MRGSTSRTPALIQELDVSLGFGFSTKRLMRPSGPASTALCGVTSSFENSAMLASPPRIS